MFGHPPGFVPVEDGLLPPDWALNGGMRVAVGTSVHPVRSPADPNLDGVLVLFPLGDTERV